MNIAGKKSVIFTHYVDDTLGITHTHMVTGYLGGFLAGLFATPEGSAAFGLTNYGGAITGNGRQVWLQIVGGLFIIGWNLFWTSAIMLFIKYVLRIPLRMSDEDCLIGDDAIHGEEAYCFLDDVTGLVPTPSIEEHAAERLARIHADTDYKGQSILEGQPFHGASESNNGSSTRKGDKADNEVKMD